MIDILTHKKSQHSMPVKSLIPTLTPKQLTQIHAHILTAPKPHTLNSLLKSLTHSPTPQNALPLYNQMLHHPTSHNHFTFTYALKACSTLHALQKGLEIHAHVEKCGHCSDVFIQNSLLYFYVMEHDIASANRVFDLISYPDVVSWTSIVSGLSKCGLEEQAIIKFSSMDVRPNCTTIVSVLSACCYLRALKFGKAIHGYSLRNLNEDNIILDNAILQFYMKCGSLVHARYLFANMRKRDVVSWTTMVGGFVQRGFCEEAVGLFQEMVKRGEAVPNEATIVNVLSGCSLLGTLSLGQWVHSYMSERDDLIVDGHLGNALINMYVKCGHMGMAIWVFNMLTVKDIVSWSTIISGMAMNGHGKQALQLFSLMLVHGVPPDGVTFIGLLSACSHAGLVNQGLLFFKAMNDVYGIMPQMQHYACVVDLYGRAGFLEEAEAFIRGMPVEADGPILGALLSACKIHGNERIFEQISRCLINTRGVSIGTLALLPNSDKIRDVLRCMGLKKMPGCSWIEVDASIHKPVELEKCHASAGK